MKRIIALILLCASPVLAQTTVFYDNGLLMTITNNRATTNSLQITTLNIGNMTLNSSGITVTNGYQEDDLRFPASAVKVGTVNPPTFEQAKAEIYLFSFSKTQEQDIHGVGQFPHSWDVGALGPHLHLSNGVYTNGGTSVWQLVWWPSDIWSKFPAVVYTNTFTNVWPKGEGTEWTHVYTNFPAITAVMHGLTNKSATIAWNLARKVGDPADTADEKEWYLEFDFHFHKKYITGRD